MTSLMLIPTRLEHADPWPIHVPTNKGELFPFGYLGIRGTLVVELKV